MPQFRQRPLNAPPSLDALVDSDRLQPDGSCPIGEGLCLAKTGDEPVGAFVVCLLRFAAPPAVFGKVSLVVVYPVDGKPQPWTRPHVLKEPLEQLPPIAHNDAPATISRVFVVVGILAPGFHVPPSVIRSCPVAPVCVAVCEASGDGPLFVEASTRNRLSLCEAILANFPDLSAVTQAYPIPVRALFFTWRENQPTSKPFASGTSFAFHEEEYIQCVM